MPYSGPGRPGHRRAYTASPGAFASLGALPRRHTVFSLANDDDDSHDDDDDVLHNIPPALKLKPNNSFRLSIPTAHPPLQVPFPRTSPLSTSPTHHYAPRPNVTRTTSTPILLSNGKPLKSSLKSSSSSPHIPLQDPQHQSHHLRARSAPSTPHMDHPVHKNVHFPNEDGGLATVRVFNRSAKPASLSRSAGDDTETETDGELSTGSNSGFIRGTSAVLPFPRSPLGQQQKTKFEIDPTESSAIPSFDPSPYANVHLESLTYTGSSSTAPPGLSGTLLVRNIAYEKQVAVRFTLDDWQTTSEVSAKYLVSLPIIPVSFIEQRQLTYGDLVALPPPPPPTTPPTATATSPQWDRFTFQIKLEDYALSGLTKRTMWLVVRYTTGTGVESWDNNSGRNYKIAFREQPLSPGVPSPLIQKRGRVFAVSSPPSFAPTTTITTATGTTQPEHAKMVAQTTLLRLRKLNLKNYAAPSTPPIPTPIITTSPQPEGMQMEGGFPAHVGEPSESETESEESVKTPGGVRSRTPSPPIGIRDSNASSPTTMVNPFEMGTSPPFSMMADLKLDGGDLMKRREGEKGSVYWAWGVMTRNGDDQEKKGNTNEESKMDDEKLGEERKMDDVIEEIREKSTSSPVRRASPTREEKKEEVISPQPKIPSHQSPPNTITNSNSTTPVPAPTTQQQDSVYQAFVRQWCFAQGPSHPIHGHGQQQSGFVSPRQYDVRGRGKSDSAEKGSGGELVV